MRKAYTKPEILFENFAVCTSIATGGCKFTSVTLGEDVIGCAYVDKRYPNKMIFTSALACTTKEDDEDYNGICYHTPLDHNLFTS